MKPIRLLLEIIIQEDGTVEYKTIGDPGIIEGPMPTKDDIKIEKMKFSCVRWTRRVNKKPEQSCHGCTIQCRMKGTYDGYTVEV